MHAELKRLSPCALRRYLRRLRWLKFREWAYLQPLPVKMAGVHFGVTAFMLFHLPAPPELSPFAIPVIWAGSLAITLNLSGLMFRQQLKGVG